MSSIPKAIGPYSAFTQKGGLLVTSGQLPIDPETNQLVQGPIEEQVKQSLDNLMEIVKAAGMERKDIVKVTIFLKDMNDFAKVNEVYATYFSEAYPSRTCVQVARLPRDASIEIELMAFKG
ncbi:MAG: RidA family protein [Erysipelotrichaceae bacterium]|jgi:2-iminobutanoate/2-iminopropanoate deaminase|nr:RidA family protein [Erysipelotrichaceae bacterium]